MNRAIKLTGLLAAALLACACERKVDNVSDYDPALDGPRTPPSPVIASALLEGKAGGGGGGEATPAPKPPTPATATAPGDTAATAPGDAAATAPVEAAGNPAADAVKAEIDGRLDQIRQLLTSEKYEEYERSARTPEEWQAAIAANAKALDTAVENDKKDPAAETKQFDAIVTVVKAAKPAVSADGNTATYLVTGGPMPAIVFKKVDGLWYFSPDASQKATPAVAPATAPAATAPAP